MTGVDWVQAGALGALGFVVAVTVYGIIRSIRRAVAVVPDRKKRNRAIVTRERQERGGPRSNPQRPAREVDRTSVEDPFERAGFEHEMEHLVRTRAIRPSRSIEPELGGQARERREGSREDLD